MQEVSELYRRLISTPGHYFEASLVVGESGRLVDRAGDIILFGGIAILVARSAADSGYQETALRAVTTTRSLFGGDSPTVGNALAGEIDVTMLMPSGEIPRMAQLIPYVRVTDGVEASEWVQKGVYYIDTRETTSDGYGTPLLTMHGYDAMLLADRDYTNSALEWPAKDITVVEEIAGTMGVSVDARTREIMRLGYSVNYPGTYTMRETLAYIAAMYAGSFVMSDTGQLRLTTMWELPRETRYLIDSAGYALTFGGVRILV